MFQKINAMLFPNKPKDKKMKKLQKLHSKIFRLKHMLQYQIRPEIFVKHSDTLQEKRDFAEFNNTLVSIDNTLKSIKNWIKKLENIKD